jgi:hypothetical protein
VQRPHPALQIRNELPGRRHGRSSIGHDSQSSPIITAFRPQLLINPIDMNLASAVRVFLSYYLLVQRWMGSEQGGGVFDQGGHSVSLTRLDEARAPPRCAVRSSPSSAASLPPKPLLVAAPRETGEYPVILFLHGYLAVNSFYSQLFEHVASHGFIVVGPQVGSSVCKQ